MGGGDLNLKKSWHPSTLRNIERVWKAEQKHEVEKQKIEQLQKELAEERAREEIHTYAQDKGVIKKREERLDWMYQGPAAMVNREDYLLGRKIDKTLEILEQEESGTEPKNNEFDVGSTMFSSQDLSGTATVDLANKIREDPLFSIMKKEKEQRKNLLSNPVKMKQLQQILQKSLNKEKHKNKERHVESSKEKHKKRHSKNGSKEKHHKKHKKSKVHSSDDEEDWEKVPRQKTNAHIVEDRHQISSKYYQSKHYSNTESTRDKESCHFNDYKSERKNPSRNGEKHYSERIYSQDSYNRSQSNKDYDNRNKRKLDEEERERRLKEMQENAKWREEQRQRKVKRLREEDEKEQKIRMDASDFIKPMLSKAAGKGSLENRVKQKIFSIQRGKFDMDKNFAKR